jgi:Resolvase, N terminal domain
MSRIGADHLAREAIVYVRQSTMDQVINNVESKRRQYGLVERARHLGWAQVSVIDDDLGRSGSGVSRPGFEKLLAAICEGRVGAVVSIEASRLARNGRDWHTLLEFCGLVGTLIADEDGVYDPRHPNDRLLLGMKGTMSGWSCPFCVNEPTKRSNRRLDAANCSPRLRLAMSETDPIESSRIRTNAFARRSHWSFASSSSCRACGRFISGSDRKGSRCPP